MGGLSRLLCVAGVVALAIAGQAQATFPGASGLVAFQSDRGGDYGIWLSRLDGSAPRVVFDGPGSHEFNPAWSPSGRWIVFQSGPLDRSTSDLHLIRADGTGLRPLVTGATNDFAAQFCDEDTILFTRQDSPASSDVYAIDVGRRLPRRLTDDPARDSFPTCHPDGRRFAFISNRETLPRVFEQRLDGRGLRALTAPGSLDPDYSPDGRLLTFSALDPLDGNTEVFALTLRTGQVVQLTSTAPPEQNRLPHFAPPFGRGVAFGQTAPNPAGPTTIAFTNVAVGAFTESPLAIAGTALRAGLCGDPGGALLFPPAAPGDPAGPGNNSAPAVQPAIDCFVDGTGQLTILGTDGPDDVRVRESGDDLRVFWNGARVATFPLAGVRDIAFVGGKGVDAFENDTSLRETVDGGAGVTITFDTSSLTGETRLRVRGTDVADRIEVRLDAPEKEVVVLVDGVPAARYDRPGQIVVDGRRGINTIVISPALGRLNTGEDVTVSFGDFADEGGATRPAASIVNNELWVFSDRGGGTIATKPALLPNDEPGIAVFADGRRLGVAPLDPQGPGRLRGILFAGGAGDDTFKNNTSLPARGFGKGGRDVFVGGTAPDRYQGDEGDDRFFLRDGRGRDWAVGGSGRDRATLDPGDRASGVETIP